MCNPPDFGWMPLNDCWHFGPAILRHSIRYIGDWRLVYPDGASRLVMDHMLGIATREIQMLLEIEELGEMIDDEY